MIITWSATKAKYVLVTKVLNKSICLTFLCNELESHKQIIVLCCHSQSFICLVMNAMLHACTKAQWCAISFHSITTWFALVLLTNIILMENLVDVFTKSRSTYQSTTWTLYSHGWSQLDQKRLHCPLSGKLLGVNA